jgi:ribosome-associated protein
MLRVSDSITLDDREVHERFVRAFGPGGQNVRKEATAVELRLDVGLSRLPHDVKERLVALSGRAITSDGVLVVSSRARRSQVENREAARARLIALLQRAAKTPKTRRVTKPRKAVREGRLAAKRRRGAIKQARSARGEQ